MQYLVENKTFVKNIQNTVKLIYLQLVANIGIHTCNDNKIKSEGLFIFSEVMVLIFIFKLKYFEQNMF